MLCSAKHRGLQRFELNPLIPEEPDNPDGNRTIELYKKAYKDVYPNVDTVTLVKYIKY